MPTIVPQVTPHMVTYFYMTYETYKTLKAAGQIVSTNLYYITDRPAVYFGTNPTTVQIFTTNDYANFERVANSIVKDTVSNKIYYCPTTNAADDILFVPGVVTAINDVSPSNEKIPTEKAVHDWVKSLVDPIDAFQYPCPMVEHINWVMPKNTNEVWISWTDPVDLILQNVTIAAFERVVLLRKAGADNYPTSIDDPNATVVFDSDDVSPYTRNSHSITSNNPLVDVVPDATLDYSYRFFTVSTAGAINSDISGAFQLLKTHNLTYGEMKLALTTNTFGNYFRTPVIDSNGVEAGETDDSLLPCSFRVKCTDNYYCDTIDATSGQGYVSMWVAGINHHAAAHITRWRHLVFGTDYQTGDFIYDYAQTNNTTVYVYDSGRYTATSGMTTYTGWTAGDDIPTGVYTLSNGVYSVATGTFVSDTTYYNRVAFTSGVTYAVAVFTSTATFVPFTILGLGAYDAAEKRYVLAPLDHEVPAYKHNVFKSDWSGYYYNGIKFEALVAGTDYQIGDTIATWQDGSEVYTYASSTYSLTEDATFQEGTTYYRRHDFWYSSTPDKYEALTVGDPRDANNNEIVVNRTNFRAGAPMPVAPTGVANGIYIGNDTSRVSYGSNRYAFSNVDTFLRSSNYTNAGSGTNPLNPFDNQSTGNIYSHPSLKRALDPEFIDILGEVMIKVALSSVASTHEGGGYENLSRSIFLMSQTEIFASGSEGSQLALFANDARGNAKYIRSFQGSARYWWTRSPYTGSTATFNQRACWRVSSVGERAVEYVYMYTSGVLPAFSAIG